VCVFVCVVCVCVCVGGGWVGGCGVKVVWVVAVGFWSVSEARIKKKIPSSFGSL
jgi:hypothetical protein